MEYPIGFVAAFCFGSLRLLHGTEMIFLLFLPFLFYYGSAKLLRWPLLFCFISIMITQANIKKIVLTEKLKINHFQLFFYVWIRISVFLLEYIFLNSKEKKFKKKIQAAESYEVHIKTCLFRL